MTTNQTRISLFLLCAAALYASGIVPAIIPAAVPTASKQGNSSKFLLATGSFTPGDWLKTDSSGNAVGCGAGCTTSVGSVVLPNPLPVGVIAPHVASGDVDLYTAPTNRRAMVAAVRVYVDNGSNVTTYIEVKISGTYYPLSVAAALSPNSGNSYLIGYVLNPGETLAINSATNAVNNAFTSIIEFDSTGNLFSASSTSLGAGNNTLYTVPIGHTAIFTGAGNLGGSTQKIFGMQDVGALSYANRSGAIRTVKTYCVPNGSSPATSNLTVQSTVANLGQAAFGICGAMNAQDFVAINIDAATATQFAWVNVILF